MIDYVPLILGLYAIIMSTSKIRHALNPVSLNPVGVLVPCEVEPWVKDAMGFLEILYRDPFALEEGQNPESEATIP